MMLAALLLAAPAIYWWIGLGGLELLGRSRERVALAPLLGFALAGWLPQLALALGGVPWFAALAFGLLALLPLRSRRELWRPEATRALGLFGFCYAVGIAILGLVPMPALGLWGTDWAMYLRAGPALLQWAADPATFATGAPELLAERPRLFASRPHLFSMAISPIAGFASSAGGVSPLAVLEIAAAVAAASLVSALGYVARRLGRPEPSLLWAAFFVSLPLFGYHLIALWPKLAASGCVLVGGVEAYGYRASRRTTDLAWAFGWLGLGVAAHHSSALYLPLLLLIVAWQRPGAPGSRLRWAAIARVLGIAACMLLLTAGIYELWALARLGLSARIANNPAVHQASSFEPVFVLTKAARQLVLAIVGGSFPPMFRNLSQAAGAETTGAALGYLSHAVSSWLVFLAGTFLGNLLPLAVAGRHQVAIAWRSFREHELFAPVAIGALLALSASALLAPILDLSAAQLGATPICVALVYFSSSRARPAVLRAALGVSLALGTLPFVATAIATRGAFARALAGDPALLDWFLQFEADTRLMLSLDAASLAQLPASLPGIAIATAAWLALAVWLHGRRSSPAPG